MGSRLGRNKRWWNQINLFAYPPNVFMHLSIFNFFLKIIFMYKKKKLKKKVKRKEKEGKESKGKKEKEESKKKKKKR